MKISIDNSVFIDRPTGIPVEGKLCVYLSGSDNLAETYTLEGTSFVRAQNPVLLHAGLPDDTLFVELGLYRLVVYRYTGPEGQMSVDSPDGYFEQADVFEFGMDYNVGSQTGGYVDTLEDLRDVDPELGVMNVLWHTEPGDCFPRTYVWDAAATDQEDGGYVVGSDVSDTGRWLLAWDDEILPCTVYGVTPDNTSNINLLLDYPERIGSIGLVTAPCIRFVPGTYGISGNYYTDRELVFDAGASFTSASFDCPKASVLGEPETYVADFSFTAPDAVAHSSWFRTVQSFWACGAHELVIDSANHFSDTVLRHYVNLEGRIVRGSSRIAMTYASGTYLRVGPTTSVTGRIFNGLDFVQVVGHGDSMFDTATQWDPGAIADGHHQDYGGVPDLDLFQNADWWVATMVERRGRFNATVWPDYTLDLQNRRTYGSIDIGAFTTLRNADVTTLVIHNASGNVELWNVNASNIIASCLYLTAHKCELTFGTTEPSVTAFTAYDSRIQAATIWTSQTMQCVFENCYIGISFHRVTDNVSRDAILSFTNCNFTDNAGIRSKTLSMYGCTTHNNAIKVYPYKSGDTYRMYVRLEGNNFNSSVPIEFTRIDAGSGVYDEACYDIILDWTILGNTFHGNTEGLRMRYWQHRAGEYYTRTFVKMASGVHSVSYSGNSGECPATDMRGIGITGTDSGYVAYDVGQGMNFYAYGSATRRVMPSISGTYWWNQDVIGGIGLMLKYYSWVESPYDSLTYDAFVQVQVHAYFKAYHESLADGDFFLMALGTFGDYIRIVQRGDNDHNRGVVAKVV